MAGGVHVGRRRAPLAHGVEQRYKNVSLSEYERAGTVQVSGAMHLVVWIINVVVQASVLITPIAFFIIGPDYHFSAVGT